MAKMAAEQSHAGGIDPSELKGRRFGRVLTKLGKVTRDQVHEALALQKARREKGQKIPIGELLVELGYINKNDVLEALAGQAGMRMVQIDMEAIPEAAFAVSFGTEWFIEEGATTGGEPYATDLFR